MALHVPANRITGILNRKRAVTADTALRLARYFDTTPGFWMNLQINDDLSRAYAETHERVDREVRARETA